MNLKECLEAAVDEFFQAGGCASGPGVSRDLLLNILLRNCASGPTGDYPDGKINSEDEGGLQITMGMNENNKFIINFGTPVKWFGMSRAEAKTFAETILEHVQ